MVSTPRLEGAGGPPAAESRVAVLYQAELAPAVDGIQKPMKPGGYSDSGADIACCLLRAGVPVVLPVRKPDPVVALDWVFPDTMVGIRDALTRGAEVLWANTVLFEGHPLDGREAGVRIVGQHPAAVQRFDDKCFTNSLFARHGLPVPRGLLLQAESEPQSFTVEDLSAEMLRARGLELPLVVKPVRGRGSEGVAKHDTVAQLKEHAAELLSATAEIGGHSYLRYGWRLIVEEYLPGLELTVTVMPPGVYAIDGEERVLERHWHLPPVRRFNHQHGVAPYSGVVAVIQNSEALGKEACSVPEVGRTVEHCETAAALVDAVAPVRIDCGQVLMARCDSSTSA